MKINILINMLVTICLLPIFICILIIYGILVLIIWIPYQIFTLILSSSHNSKYNLEIIPGPIEYPFIGSILLFIIKSDFLLFPPKALEAYANVSINSPFIRMSVGILRDQLMLLVNDPEVINEILTKPNIYIKGPGYDVFRGVTPGHLPALDGIVANRIRDVLIKAFSTKFRKQFIKICLSNATKLFKNIKDKYNNIGNQSFEISLPIKNMAFDIIIEVMFGKIILDTNVRESFHDIMMEWNERITEIIPFRLFIPHKLLTRQRKLIHAMKNVREFIATRVLVNNNRTSIDNNIKQTIDYSLSMLDTILEEGNKLENPLNSEEIFYACFTMIAMGHENVSSSITWAIALISTNLTCQENIRNEIKTCLINKQQQKDVEDVSQLIDKICSIDNDLKYTEVVFKETIRLFPVVPMLSREASSEILDLKGLHLPPPHLNYPKVELIITPWTIHRSKSIWGNDADLFIPERWLSVNHQPWKLPGVYFPFGLGARACLGSLFAKYEYMAVIASAIIELDSFTICPDKYNNSNSDSELLCPLLEISMKPKHGVWLKLQT